MREGLKVKEGEQPLKTAKSRAVTINKRRAHELAISEGRDEDTMQGLYAQWQTVKSIPPPIVDVWLVRYCQLENRLTLDTGNCSAQWIWKFGFICTAHAPARWCASSMLVTILLQTSDTANARQPDKGTAKIAKQLGIDFAEAVVCDYQ